MKLSCGCSVVRLVFSATPGGLDGLLAFLEIEATLDFLTLWFFGRFFLGAVLILRVASYFLMFLGVCWLFSVEINCLLDLVAPDAIRSLDCPLDLRFGET